MGQQISIPLIVTLVALLVLAGLQLLAQGTPAARPPAPEATDPGSESPSQVQLPQFSLPPVEEFAETLARPLFYEARQPPDSSPANELDPQPQSNSGSAETLIISAIVLTGEEQFVLVQNPGKQSLKRVEKGEEIAGWSLAEIRNESVLLRKADQTKVVPLWRFQPPPQQAATARSRESSKQRSQQQHQKSRRIQRRVPRQDANN